MYFTESPQLKNLCPRVPQQHPTWDLNLQADVQQWFLMYNTAIEPEHCSPLKALKLGLKLTWIIEGQTDRRMDTSHNIPAILWQHNSEWSQRQRWEFFCWEHLYY